MTGSAAEINLLVYHFTTLVFLIGFSINDIRYHKVLNRHLLWFLPWCLLSLPLNSMSSPILPFSFTVGMAILGFLNGGLLLLLISLLTQGGIGGGDIKLSAFLGFVCGSYGICVILFTAALFALLFVLLRTLFFGKKREPVPFVPFLSTGMIVFLVMKRIVPFWSV